MPKMYDDLINIIQDAINETEKKEVPEGHELLKHASLQSMRAVLGVIEQQQEHVYSNEYAFEALDDLIISMKEAYENGDQDILDPEQMRGLLLSHVDDLEENWGLGDE